MAAQVFLEKETLNVLISASEVYEIVLIARNPTILYAHQLEFILTLNVCGGEQYTLVDKGTDSNPIQLDLPQTYTLTPDEMRQYIKSTRTKDCPFFQLTHDLATTSSTPSW